MPWWAGRIVPFSLYRYISSYLKKKNSSIPNYFHFSHVNSRYIYLKCLCSNLLKSQAVGRRKYIANSLNLSFFSPQIEFFIYLMVICISHLEMYNTIFNPWVLFYQEKNRRNHFSVTHKIK